MHNYMNKNSSVISELILPKCSRNGKWKALWQDAVNILNDSWMGSV